jgi:hypothetical protein
LFFWAASLAPSLRRHALTPRSPLLALALSWMIITPLPRPESFSTDNSNSIAFFVIEPPLLVER